MSGLAGARTTLRSLTAGLGTVLAYVQSLYAKAERSIDRVHERPRRAPYFSSYDVSSRLALIVRWLHPQKGACISAGTRLPCDQNGVKL